MKTKFSRANNRPLNRSQAKLPLRFGVTLGLLATVAFSVIVLLYSMVVLYDTLDALQVLIGQTKINCVPGNCGSDRGIAGTLFVARNKPK